MTTAAMVIGVVPLLLANGAGARSRFDIGIVIAAGMAIGTLFTLFITPAVYTYLARDHRKTTEAELEPSAPPATEAEAEPAPAEAADGEVVELPKTGRRRSRRDKLPEAAE
jgi:hypothetical protein